MHVVYKFRLYFRDMCVCLNFTFFFSKPNIMIYIFIIFLVSLNVVRSEWKPEEIIKTNNGFVKGFVDYSYNSTQFLSFEGIPYAKPPIGSLRFKDPEPVSKWKGILHANMSYSCMQYYHYTDPGDDFVRGEEDCLYLNIYVPIKTQNEPPFNVIIFIHGGAFMFNSGKTYGPRGLMDYGKTVFVSINYRLGPLGFLCTEDEKIPGNMGLKDQALALKWIKENIHHFYGNPNSITVSGMSAGGASVQLHTLSPLSKDLFHKAIIQSGTALNPWVLVENSKEKAKKLGDIIGCSEYNKDFVVCLQEKPARQIVSAVKHFQPWLYNPFSPFGVVVDKWSNTPFLTEHPYILLQNKQVQNVPAIFSNVGSEGLYPCADFIGNKEYLEEIKTRWNELAPFILDYNLTTTPERCSSVSNRIKEFYFKESGDFIKNLIKVVSDRLFIYNIEQAAKLHSRAISSNVYYYSYLYRGANSKATKRIKANIDFGASHGDDTVCILSSDVNTRTTPEDTEMSNQLTQLWLTFSETGIAKLSNNSPNWPTVSKNYKEDLIYLQIVSPFKQNVLKTKSLGNGDFWRSLDLLENENIFSKNIKKNTKGEL